MKGRGIGNKQRVKTAVGEGDRRGHGKGGWWSKISMPVPAEPLLIGSDREEQ